MTGLVVCSVEEVNRFSPHDMHNRAWLYLGKDLEKREAVARRLGEEGLLSLGNRLHEVAERLRQPFLDFIADLGKMQTDQLGWWSSSCSWKIAGASDLFLLVCYQHLADHLIRARQTDDRPLLVVVEDSWLFRQLREVWTGKAEVEFRGTVPLWPACLRASVLGVAARVVWTVRLLKNYLLQTWFWKWQKTVTPPRTEIGIYSLPQARSLAEPDGWIDPYFGDLSTRLEQAGYSVCRFSPPEVGGFERALGERHQYLRPLVLYITVGGVVRAIFASWRPRWPSCPEVGGQPVHWLLLREWWKDRWRSSYFLFRVFFQCMLRFLETEQFAALIYPYENQPWEKMLVLSARARGMMTIGYYHSAGLGRFLLQYFHGVGEIDFLPLPDLIVTSGPYAHELLGTGGTPPDRLVMGGSLRFQYLWHYNEPVPTLSSGDPVRILVATPLNLALARHLLYALRRAFPDGGRAEGVEFAVKSHPMCPVSEESLRWPATIVAGTFEEAIRPCAVVISSGSSTGMEALAMGRRVLRYRSELLLDLDVAEFIGGEDIVDCGDHDLRAKIISVIQAPAQRPRGEWSESLKRVFAPVDDKVWLENVDRLARQHNRPQPQQDRAADLQPAKNASSVRPVAEEVMDASLTFSVVIPAYNAERFIVDALNSVARQTFTEYEIVVVDDGSKDGTSKQVRAWSADHQGIELRLLQQENKGIGQARNTGVRSATGTYVAFLDSDDIWMEQKLETVALRLARPLPAELICHDEWLEEAGHRPRRLTYGPHSTYKEILFKGNPLSTSATVVRRQKLLEVGGFSEDLRFNSVEDYDLWLRLARSGCRIEYVHEVLGTYRQHGQGITSKIEMHCEHYLNVLEAHFSGWQKKTPCYRYLMRRRRAAVLRGACRAFMQRGESREAQRFFLRALFEDPFSWKGWALGILNLVV